MADLLFISSFGFHYSLSVIVLFVQILRRI